MTVPNPLARPALILGDHRALCDSLAETCRAAGLDVVVHALDEPWSERLAEADFGAVVACPLRPETDRLKLIGRIRAVAPEIPLIALASRPGEAPAFRAADRAITDVLIQPVDPERLVQCIRRALKLQPLRDERGAVPCAGPSDAERDIDDILESLTDVLGCSAEVRGIAHHIASVAPTEFFVLVTGESGVGKESLARVIHRFSARSLEPFRVIDASELSAWWERQGDRPRPFPEPGGGTLFLREVSALPGSVQSALIRAMDEAAANGPARSSRLVAGSTVDLLERVRNGLFREDLYHRLAEYAFTVPPLRERHEDLLFLVQRFLRGAADEMNKGVNGVTSEALRRILQHRWPGNARELRNAVRRAVLVADRAIGPEHLEFLPAPQTRGAKLPPSALLQPAVVPSLCEPPMDLDGEAPSAEAAASANGTDGTRAETPLFRDGKSFKELIREHVQHLERRLLEEALRRTRGNKAEAARLLKLDYKTVHTKCKQAGLSARRM